MSKNKSCFWKKTKLSTALDRNVLSPLVISDSAVLTLLRIYFTEKKHHFRAKFSDKN